MHIAAGRKPDRKLDRSWKGTRRRVAKHSNRVIATKQPASRTRPHVASQVAKHSNRVIATKLALSGLRPSCPASSERGDQSKDDSQACIAHGVPAGPGTFATLRRRMPNRPKERYEKVARLSYDEYRRASAVCRPPFLVRFSLPIGSLRCDRHGFPGHQGTDVLTVLPDHKPLQNISLWIALNGGSRSIARYQPDIWQLCHSRKTV
ncbi:MAG: hypothetical protein RLY70_1578 [Planctomycetota bacterium]